MNDREKGIYEKFRVERVDPEAQARHSNCFHFVLDLECDRYAAAATKAYAEACAGERPQLAMELMDRAEHWREQTTEPLGVPAPGEEGFTDDTPVDTIIVDALQDVERKCIEFPAAAIGLAIIAGARIIAKAIRER